MALNPSYIHIFEFDPKYMDFDVFFKDKFQGTTAKKTRAENMLQFCINSNYFNKDGNPLGLVVKDGKELNPVRSNWKGYFFVKNNKPYFGSKSYFDRIQGKLSSASQAMPSLLGYGRLWAYVTDKNNPHFQSGIVSYRSVGGMKKNGQIVFFVSGNGGTLNFMETGLLAKKLNLQHATNFDGGAALQYSFQHKGYRLGFHAANTWLPLPWVKLWSQKPPVYIGVKTNKK